MALIAPNAPRTIAAPTFGIRRPAARSVAIALAAVFLGLTVDGLFHAHAFFDLWLLQEIQRVDLPLLTAVLHPVDTLTSSTGAVTMWAAILLAFVLVRRWLPALATLTLPAGGVINYAVGQLVDRSRPDAAVLQRWISETDAASFPSGHVMGAVMLYGFLFVVADRIANRYARYGVKVACIAIIAIAGFGRMWYGAHWPTDVLGAYALGGLILMPLVAVYRRLDAVAGQLPFIHAAPVPHDETQPHAHALTSLVLFNGATVSKVYAPGFVPRALYWLAFQAPFPYIGNLPALRAALHRRNLAGMLTEHWYGANRVARVTRIDRVAGGYALTSEFVDGQAPTDKAAAKAFLRDLRQRFEEAGLPTWQIDPRQPRAVDNLIETPAGLYRIVDLESGLVSPLASLRTWRRALRRGLVPLFDDVFFDVTRAYIAREAPAMRAARGEAWFAALTAELDAAAAAAAAWHRSEPRLWRRLARGLGSGFGVRTWPARLRARFAGSQDKAREWIARAVTTWEAEGRVSAEEAAAMRVHMNGAEFQAMLPHLGAHIIITIILRFPFGSIARMGWSLGVLASATGRLLLRRSDRRAWKQAWSIHSPLVIVLSAVPGFGTFAYLAAKPVRSNRLLLRATADAVLKKVPWRLYERTGLRHLIARPAPGAPVADGSAGPSMEPAAPVTLSETLALAPAIVAPARAGRALRTVTPAAGYAEHGGRGASRPAGNAEHRRKIEADAVAVA